MEAMAGPWLRLLATSPAQSGIVAALLCGLPGLVASPVPLVEGGSLDAPGSICSGRGAMVKGRCACPLGWTGADCSLDSCAQMLCAGRSHCEAGICRCEVGFLAPDCSIDTCPGHFPEGSALGCFGAAGHGECLRGTCVCAAGWRGVACEQPACLANCNGRGRCTGPGLCECSAGWAGDGCERRALDLGSMSESVTV